jgi:hypothetical protein
MGIQYQELFIERQGLEGVKLGVREFMSFGVRGEDRNGGGSEK